MNFSKPYFILILVVLFAALTLASLLLLAGFLTPATQTANNKLPLVNLNTASPETINKGSVSTNLAPSLTVLSVPLNPQHGIHAPVGFQWTDKQREVMTSFQDEAGEKAPPGTVVALSTDLLASNNRAKISMQEDLFQYAKNGSQVYIRMYPQRFPGGFSEKRGPDDGRNSISGTPFDAATDILNFLKEQQVQTGHHFNRIIPGNEPNLEWPNGNYYQNILEWQTNDDPAKYDAINSFMLQLYQEWKGLIAQPDAVIFRDVELYFPALAQDGHPDYFGGAYFYQDNKPVANKYDRLRRAIELFGHFSWHNYFRPGLAWDDRAVAAFPIWLLKGLANGWPYLISEAGWTPDALALPVQRDVTAYLAHFWRRLKWSPQLSNDDRPQWLTQDETIKGFNFEDDIRYFIQYCAGNSPEGPILKPGVAVWLAGSEGNFSEATGIEPGPTGKVHRWMENYAAWKK